MNEKERKINSIRFWIIRHKNTIKFLEKRIKELDVMLRGKEYKM